MTSREWFTIALLVVASACALIIAFGPQVFGVAI